MLKKLLNKVLDYVRKDGLHVASAYVGALVSLVVAGGISGGASAELALLPAAAVATAKQLNAPAFVVSLLDALQAKLAAKPAAKK